MRAERRQRAGETMSVMKSRICFGCLAIRTCASNSLAAPAVAGMAYLAQRVRAADRYVHLVLFGQRLRFAVQHQQVVDASRERERPDVAGLD